MCVYVRMCTHRERNGMGRGGDGIESWAWEWRKLSESMFIMHQRKKRLWAEVRVTVES